MSSSWLLYLAAATGCQAVFALFYWLVLARLSAFGWNRAYLLSSLVLSVALPLVALPAAWAQLVWPAVAPEAAWALPAWKLGAATPTAAIEMAAPASFSWEVLVLAAYWLGVAWQAGRTLRSLGWLYRLGRRHPRTRLGQGWLVQLPEPSRPAFSFGRTVFLSPMHAQLNPAEYAQLVQHEQVHGAQYHSLDLLFAEAINWFFWFNGLVFYLRRELRTVHEYLADAAVARPAGSRVAYGHLLLKLASGPLPTALVHPFSTRQVARRILMLTNPPSSPMKKMRFLLVLPVAALAWVGAAMLGPAPAVAASAPVASPRLAQSRIGKITWQGNTFLTTAQLNQALGLQPGDPYSKEVLDAKLNRPDGASITSRYMDQGYLFFSIEPTAKTLPDGTTDLTFVLAEGHPFRLGTITVMGANNHTLKLSSHDLLGDLPLHSGDLFSRAKLVESQRLLAASGKVEPTKIGVLPRPVVDVAKDIYLVNINFAVIEK
ncbi:MAG: POTRA domain-containing protein [Janthinobacterium lividum]